MRGVPLQQLVKLLAQTSGTHVRTWCACCRIADDELDLHAPKVKEDKISKQAIDGTVEGSPVRSLAGYTAQAHPQASSFRRASILQMHGAGVNIRSSKIGRR